MILKVALSGSSGRMGKILEKLIKKEKSFSLVDVAHRSRHPDLWNPKKITGVIDFSLPPLFEQSLDWCLKNKKPFLSGTTGLSAKQTRKLKRASKSIPILYATNMSFGISQMLRWLRALKNEDFKAVEIKEIHHLKKKDKPSGTALSLKQAFYSKKRIPIRSLRKGKELGTHQVTIKFKKEVLVLEHQALCRSVFAEGALRALRWLKKQKPGFYSIEDINKEVV